MSSKSLVCVGKLSDAHKILADTSIRNPDLSKRPRTLLCSNAIKVVRSPEFPLHFRLDSPLSALTLYSKA